MLHNTGKRKNAAEKRKVQNMRTISRRTKLFDCFDRKTEKKGRKALDCFNRKTEKNGRWALSGPRR